MQRQTIGRYQIREELGRGAMGIVFRAEDELIGRAVAIKTIRLDIFPDPVERGKLKERLLREARSAGLLSHPNIVTVFDIGEEEGIAFIAMEYVEGETLEQALRARSKLAPPLIASVITQVALALDYAHGKGVVHRDIKPGNLMLTPDGSIRIADFGVAKLLSHQATQSDMMLGTPSYMAPEQIEARTVDGRTDQFSLAVIAYELLTGERPFQGELLATLLFRILHETPAPAHLLNAALNERVTWVLERALAKAPDDRFATCSAFATALSQALAACGNWQPLGRAEAGSMATVITESPAPATPVILVEPPAFLLAEAAGPEKIARRGWAWSAVILMAAGAALAAGWIYWPDAAPPKTPVTARTPEPVNDPTRPSPLSEAANQPAGQDQPSPSSTTAIPGKPNSAPATPVSGVVEIASDPLGATVRIDDTKDQCKTPCSMELSQGRHVLHFSLSGHRDGTLVVTVPLETTASIRLDAVLGTLLVQTTPSGATLLLNGQAQKDTSPATLRLTPGKYRLTLRRDGVRDHTQEIEVRAETMTQVEFTWP